MYVPAVNSSSIPTALPDLHEGQCRVRVRARVRARVRGAGGVFPHTPSCKAGLSGMWFNEVARDLVESEQVVKRVAPIPHATKQKQLSPV